jgi:hypothetical protein
VAFHEGWVERAVQIALKMLEFSTIFSFSFPYSPNKSIWLTPCQWQHPRVHRPANVGCCKA